MLDDDLELDPKVTLNAGSLKLLGGSLRASLLFAAYIVKYMLLSDLVALLRHGLCIVEEEVLTVVDALDPSSGSD